MSIDVAITTEDEWFIGEAKTLQFTVYVPGTSQADIDDGSASPQNITGWTLKFTLQDGSGGVAFTKQTGSGITLISPASGLLQVAIARADTLSLTAGTFHFFTERTDSGFESILSRGSATLQKP